MIETVLFDVFGTVVDWRTSLISYCLDFDNRRGGADWESADWAGLVDDWRAGYAPALDSVRRGERPWISLDRLHREILDNLLPRYSLEALTPADRDTLNLGWHRLTPWPDSLPGLHCLKERFVIGTLSNGNVRLLANMAKHAALPWDLILGADLFRHYKPDPELYRGAVELLDTPSGNVLLVAAHNEDLAAARACGLATAFVPRPTEYGPRQSKDFGAKGNWDYVASDIEELASRLP